MKFRVTPGDIRPSLDEVPEGLNLCMMPSRGEPNPTPKQIGKVLKTGGFVGAMGKGYWFVVKDDISGWRGRLYRDLTLSETFASSDLRSAVETVNNWTDKCS